MKPEQIIEFAEDYFSAICHFGTRCTSLGIYFRNSIPDRKLLSAKRKYAKFNSDEESALLLIDDSLWGTARKGFVMTESYIYYSLVNQDNDTIISGVANGALSLAKVKSIILEEKILTTNIVVNGAVFANINYISRNEINILNDFFSKLFSSDNKISKESANEQKITHEELNNEQADWYYEKDGRQIGPVSGSDIKASVETGFLSYSSMVWKRGSPSWVKLENSALKHLLLGNVPPPINTKIGISVSPRGFGYKRCVTMILLVCILGLLFNFYKSYEYASDTYAVARNVNKAYTRDVTIADRCNAGLGYFITLAIAPKGGASLVSNFNPWTYQENTPEAKAMLELKNRAHNDFGAATEYYRRHGK